MGLDVDSPAPPNLTNRGVPTDVDPAAVDSERDLRRAELEATLEEGAWEEAFEEWAEYTDLSGADYRNVRAGGLFGQLDFYWDPTAEALGHEVPDPPEEWSDGRTVAAELSDLAELVVETLETEYTDWDDRTVPEWTEETFDEDVQPEE